MPRSYRPRKEYLGVTKDTEAVSEALRLIADEAEINDVLRKAKGRARIEKVFG